MPAPMRVEPAPVSDVPVRRLTSDVFERLTVRPTTGSAKGFRFDLRLRQDPQVALSPEKRLLVDGPNGDLDGHAKGSIFTDAGLFPAAVDDPNNQRPPRRSGRLTSTPDGETSRA